MKTVLVVGRDLKRAKQVLCELYENKLDQINIPASPRRLVQSRGFFLFKDGTRFLAAGCSTDPRLVRSIDIDQVFFEEGSFQEALDLQMCLTTSLVKSEIPSEFQWVKLFDERGDFSEKS